MPQHLADRILAGRDALEGERKQVTVLFADIKGSTELIEGLDPEDAKALLEPAVRAMLSAVHRYEGTVCRVMGDGIMALFGAPIAHEDHAARACYAALTMQEEISNYGEATRERDGIEVLARVGLNSGEVVVGSISNDLHVEYSAIGATTHLAARMEQLAVPGTVRLTAETLRLAEGLVEVKTLGRIPVKGVSAPVEAFELLGATAARRRFQAAATRGLTPFVGRQDELEALQRALERAGSGHGQIVAPVGEPGVGKSRLFYEFVHSHRTQGWTILESGSVSYGRATAYLPAIDLLRAYCRIEPRDDPRTAREKLIGKVLGLDRALEPILPPLLALLDLPVDDPGWAALDPPQRRQETLDGLRRLLLRESQEQPLLLVFEDLHWIDAETQALLDGLVESLPTARILLLVNYRPEYTHGWGNRSCYTQLRIDPLGQESAEALLAGLLGDDPSMERLKPLLIQRTEGTPFFLEESVRTLIETGVLAGERGGYRLVRPVDEIRVPATVQAVLAARIDRLPPQEKRLLQTAAVIGKDVPFSLLRAIADVPDAELEGSLSSLQGAELLYPVSLFPELELTFKHALTHEVAYGSLLQERRRAIHARVIQAIETQYPGRLNEQIDRLAHHALRAETWEQAVAFCRQAGGRAYGRSAFREAAAYFEQTLTALGRLPERRDVLEQAVDVRLELRAALLPLAEMERMDTLTREAVAIAEAIGDQRRLTQGLTRLTHSLFAAGKVEEARTVGERGLALAMAFDDLLVQVNAQNILGQTYLVQGEYRRAVTAFNGIREAAAGAHPAMVSPAIDREVPSALSFLATCLAQIGEFEQAAACGREAIRRAEAGGYRFTHAQVYIYLGFACVRRGDALQAVSYLERGADLCEAWGIAHLAPLAGAYLGAAYTLAGRLDEAQTRLEEALAQAVARGRLHGAHREVFLGEAYLRAGRLDEAAEVATRALRGAQARGERADGAYAHRLLGEIAMSHEPLDARHAAEQYRAALDEAERLELRPLQARCHLGLGRLYRRVGRTDEARTHLATAVEMLREMGMTHWLSEAEAELLADDASA